MSYLDSYYNYRRKYYKFRGALFDDIPRLFRALLIIWILLKVLKFTKFGRTYALENPFKNPNTVEDADYVARMGDDSVSIGPGMVVPAYDDTEDSEDNNQPSIMNRAASAVSGATVYVIDKTKEGVVYAYNWLKNAAQGAFKRKKNEVNI